MVVAEARPGTAAHGEVSISAFGIHLSTTGSTSGRGARWELASPAEVERRWRGVASRCLVDWRYADGRPMLRVDGGDGGYRVYAPRFGRHHVSADGRRIVSALPRLAAWRWQRLFYAQTLPLAAALQGLDLFHASAVVRRGRAIAFVADSGTGKTSLAAQLVARGSELLTDDVLALDAENGDVRAHPGARMASIAPHEYRALGPAGRRRLGSPIGRSDKLHVAVEPHPAPVPLAAIYFLRRRGDATRASVRAPAAVDPRALLASSFLLYMRSPERLLTHLEVCARLARSVPAYELLLPGNGTAADAAAAVEHHGGGDA